MAWFIRAKSDSSLWERQSAGRLEGRGCPKVLAKLSYNSLGSGKSRLSFIPSNLFPGFSCACVCAVPLSDLFFSRFPRLLFMVPIWNMPHSSASSTAHALSKRNPSLFSPPSPSAWAQAILPAHSDILSIWQNDARNFPGWLKSCFSPQPPNILA